MFWVRVWLVWQQCLGSSAHLVMLAVLWVQLLDLLQVLEFLQVQVQEFLQALVLEFLQVQAMRPLCEWVFL
jgi:hypothetical protein